MRALYQGSMRDEMSSFVKRSKSRHCSIIVIELLSSSLQNVYEMLFTGITHWGEMSHECTVTCTVYCISMSECVTDAREAIFP